MHLWGAAAEGGRPGGGFHPPAAGCPHVCHPGQAQNALRWVSPLSAYASGLLAWLTLGAFFQLSFGAGQMCIGPCALNHQLAFPKDTSSAFELWVNAESHTVPVIQY